MPRSVETRPRATILVVDDDHDMMRIMLHMLAGAGYYPIPAHGGRAALRQAQQRPPDLVLTDLQMPDISGVEVITRLKGDPRTACIPVLAVTGCEWDELSRSAAHAGCDGYISKPVRRGMLLLAIEQAIAHSRSPGTCDPDPPAAA